MNHHPRTTTTVSRLPRSLLQTAAAGGLVALVLAGCGHTEPEPTTAPPSAAAVPGSAETVAVAALARIFSYRPVDEPPGASLARARELLGPTLLRVLDTPPDVAAPRMSLQWAQWQAAGARVEAFTFASAERSGDTDPTVAHRKIGIEQTVHYPDGRTDTLPPTAVVATVVHTPHGWRLDGYQ